MKNTIIYCFGFFLVGMGMTAIFSDTETTRMIGGSALAAAFAIFYRPKDYF